MIGTILLILIISNVTCIILSSIIMHVKSKYNRGVWKIAV